MPNSADPDQLATSEANELDLHCLQRQGISGFIMEAILKFSNWHLLPNPKSNWAETWWEASQWHRDSKLLKSFHSDIQDGRQDSHLEILQTTSPP